MNYSRKAIGLLKSQYLSVLKKCALINAGLFILSAPVMAAEPTSVLDALKNGGDYTFSGTHEETISSDIKINNDVTINGTSDSIIKIITNGYTITNNKNFVIKDVNSFSIDGKIKNNGEILLSSVKIEDNRSEERR